MLWLLRPLVVICAGLTLLGSAAGQTANGGEGPMLRVGFNAAPALAYFNEDGAPDGQIVRITQKLLAKAARPAEIGIYPTPRLLKSLQDGELDLSVLDRAGAPEGCCLFSTAPLMTQVLRIYWLAKQTPIHSKEELLGKSLIVVHGDGYAGLIDFVRDENSRIRVQTAPTFAAGWQLLASGGADYLLADEVTLQETAGDSLPKNLKSAVIGRFPVHLVLNKRYPEASREMARLESLLRDIDAGR